MNDHNRSDYNPKEKEEKASKANHPNYAIMHLRLQFFTPYAESKPFHMGTSSQTQKD